MIAIPAFRVVGGFGGETVIKKGGREKSPGGWVGNLREVLKARRISVPRLLDVVVGHDGKGREHLRKVLYGSVPAPLNPQPYFKELAEGIVHLNPISENPQLEVREILRRILAGTPYEVENGETRTSRPLPKLFAGTFKILPTYPKAFRKQLGRTVRLSMFGTNLRRHRSHQKLIEDILKNEHSHIDVLLCDPESPAARFAAFQETGKDDQISVNRFIAEVESTYRWLCALKTNDNNQNYDKLNIYKIDYALTFGLDALEFSNGRGIIYLRFYPLMDNERDSDRPIIAINSGNEEWYSFFKIQWQLHKECARPWPCTSEANKQSK